MSTRSLTAKCLCGAVSIQASATTDVEACHCGMCRRWGGGPFLSVQCGSDVKFTGEDNVARFDSSQWAARGFCRKCGTHLFYHFKPANQYVLPAGLFETQDGFEFKEQIFVDKKPEYYDFSNNTHMLTEAEVYAKFAPKQ